MLERPLPEPGTKDGDNVEWLIKFLAADFSSMPLDGLKVVLQDVRHLARLATSELSPAFPRWEIIVGDEKLTTDTPIQNVYRERPLRDQLNGYQRVLKRAIGELTTANRTVLYITTSLSHGTVPFEIVRHKNQRYPTLSIGKGTIGEVFMAFDYRMLFVLQAYADSIGLCPYEPCSKVFLKSRSDKEYCSKECGSNDRVQKWRTEQKQKQRLKRRPSTKGGKHGKKKR